MAKEAREKSTQESAFIAVARTRGRAYLRLPNVTSVGVGYRITEGKMLDELAIQFTVERKLAPEALALEGLQSLPPSIQSADGEEFVVDVVQRSFQPSYRIISEPGLATKNVAEDVSRLRKIRHDPIAPGISISHVDGSAGTIGAIVFDAQNGTPYVLSNWHVLNGPTGKIGDDIVQPGPFDDGNIAPNTMGRLVRSHLGLAGDCAVCSIVGRRFDQAILEVGVAPSRIAEVSLGDAVVKSGRTTGVTHGKVNRVGVVVKIDYGSPTGEQQVGGFEIGVNPGKPSTDGEISMGGDSGSVWMIDTTGTDRNVAVGLHFAGETDPNPAAEHAVACSIHSVLKKLQIGFGGPVAPPASAASAAARKPRKARSKKA